VTDVVVTRDLSIAEVFVMAKGGLDADLIKGLLSARGFLHRELKSRLTLRAVPELRFKVDQAAEHGSRIDELLGGLRPHSSE
jgi:ribosome-binding factor A